MDNPETLLSVRKREFLIPWDRANSLCGRMFRSLPAAFFQDFYPIRDPRTLHKCSKRDFDLKDFLQTGNHLCCGERVTTEFKEALIQAYAFDLQHFTPDLR